MRDIPEEMAARIAGGAATLCHAWIVTRRDEVRLGFTDHDCDLVVGDVTCRAASGWTAGAARSQTGPGAGDASVLGVLDDDTLDAEAIAAGLFDGAQVELWRIDWSEPSLRVRLWLGTLAALKLEGDRFLADIEGPLAKLDRVVGRTYGRLCDARLGDARCGIDPGDYPGAICDGRWETCVGTFGNGLNFRGFADIPGDDFLAARAGTGQDDGGSRRS